jgi:hypothetical protein
VRGDVDWTWDYTLLLTHDPTTRTTYVVVVGLTAVEIDLVQSYLTSLTSALGSASTRLCTHPLSLPTIFLDLATDDTASLLKLRIKLLAQIQQRTGMDRFNSLKSATIEGRRSISGKEQERQALDLDAVMLRLTCLSDWVAAQRGFIGLQRRIVSVVNDMLNDQGMAMTEECDRSARMMLKERLAFVTESLLAAENKSLYLERSIGAQVQTVRLPRLLIIMEKFADKVLGKIYSLIGQKDNRLNISAASASCQIASDSRRIAILTRRDSTDMRIIAAVTLIFLPGTFVATVFSTGFFDWGNGDPTSSSDNEGSGGGKIVSGYIWVYFMLTGILTFVVLAGWILFSWFQNRRMMRQFSLGPEQDHEFDHGIEKRTDTETTLVDERGGRGFWALKEFEKWKDEAKGSLRWWRGKRQGERTGSMHV